jgi:methionine-gamma-lyase
MLSFELKGGLEAGKKFIDNLQMCTRAVSLGTADTLISHPASMSHYGVSREGAFAIWNNRRVDPYERRH